jgi:hypothetical protein
MNILCWKRSSDGFSETHCLHYKIEPEYWGRCNAQSYRLVYFADVKTFKGGLRLGSHDTQREAKQRAHEHANAAMTQAEAKGLAAYLHARHPHRKSNWDVMPQDV